jgi:hypothetical protein
MASRTGGNTPTTGTGTARKTFAVREVDDILFWESSSQALDNGVAPYSRVKDTDWEMEFHLNVRNWLEGAYYTPGEVQTAFSEFTRPVSITCTRFVNDSHDRVDRLLLAAYCPMRLMNGFASMRAAPTLRRRALRLRHCADVLGRGSFSQRQRTLRLRKSATVHW